MSRRNRPVPERPMGDKVDTRSAEDLAASVRRKLLFALLAIAAIPMSLALSWMANQARETIMQDLLPAGVTMESPVKGESGPTVRDALARVGAYPAEGMMVDYQGGPILFRRDGKDLPYKDGAVPKVEAGAKPDLDPDAEVDSDSEVKKTLTVVEVD